jgi:hypothetical protein
MTNEELNAIEARLEKATPGPWVADGSHIDSPEGSVVWGNEYGVSMETYDADFIANSHEDIKRLISFIKKLKKLLKL